MKKARSANCVVRLCLAFILCSTAVLGQTPDRDAGIKAFQEGNFAKAIELLEKATSAGDQDATAWAILGSAYLKADRPKDAIRVFERSVKLEPNNAINLSNLAMAYLATADKKAVDTAKRALATDSTDANANYVLGSAELKAGSFRKASESATRAISSSPRHAVAYRLRSQALVAWATSPAEFTQSTPASKHQMLTAAASDLERAAEFTSVAETKAVYASQSGALMTFAAKYKQLNEPVRSKPLLPETSDPSFVPLKIISKKPASYTATARAIGVTGTVRLLVGFQTNGTVGPIIIIKSLEPSLDAAAWIAAREIRFTPAKENGSPIFVAKMIEYGFSIY